MQRPSAMLNVINSIERKQLLETKGDFVAKPRVVDGGSGLDTLHA